MVDTENGSRASKFPATFTLYSRTNVELWTKTVEESDKEDFEIPIVGDVDDLPIRFEVLFGDGTRDWIDNYGVLEVPGRGPTRFRSIVTAADKAP